jgi:hypothetical protein
VSSVAAVVGGAAFSNSYGNRNATTSAAESSGSAAAGSWCSLLHQATATKVQTPTPTTRPVTPNFALVLDRRRIVNAPHAYTTDLRDFKLSNDDQFVAETGIHFVYAQENLLGASRRLPPDRPGPTADDRLQVKRRELII